MKGADLQTVFPADAYMYIGHFSYLVTCSLFCPKSVKFASLSFEKKSRKLEFRSQSGYCISFCSCILSPPTHLSEETSKVLAALITCAIVRPGKRVYREPTGPSLHQNCRISFPLSIGLRTYVYQSSTLR
jgi:hypothetical protein